MKLFYILIIISWALGIAIMFFHNAALVVLLWSLPAGYAAGEAISELTKGK